MRAYPPRVRPGLAIEHLLVILGRRQRDELRPIRQSHERHFLAAQELFDEDAISSVAELLLLEDKTEILLSLRFRLDDDDAFAGGQSVDLDDRRVAELLQRRLGLIDRRTDPGL